MSGKTKLELTWMGKDQELKLEPRILLEDPELSYHADFRVSENDIFDNRLIFGDNLLALKALEQEFTGKVKCIFIDPPYNTGQAFQQYDDGLEHSLWLDLMNARLKILYKLLSNDGSIFICVDDNEVHYLKVLMDEIFGRDKFVATVVWRSTDNSNNDAKQFSLDHNYLLVYAKSADWVSNKLERTPEQTRHYSNPDNDPRGPWFDGNPISSPKPRPNLRYELVAPNGNIIKPPANGWRWSKETMMEKIKSGEIRFTEDGRNIKRRTYLADQKGLPPSTLWANLEETGHNRQAKYEQKNLFPGIPTSELFATPKPERLVKKVLEIATNPGDLVLDSFAGSGTTGAVAHKMGRRWIMIELGEHCHTHIIPRMKKVIDGTDQGGISKAVNWKGGGGFRYYRLAPSLLEKDKFGNWVISKEYNAEMLSEAMCKHKGFTYQPDESVFWKHGKSTETDYIFTTTQLVTRELVDQIQAQMGEDETLLICCKAYNVNPHDYPRITFEKIPQSVLKRCEFGRDDYSLNIRNLPRKEIVEQISMFGEEDN